MKHIVFVVLMLISTAGQACFNMPSEHDAMDKQQAESRLMRSLLNPGDRLPADTSIADIDCYLTQKSALLPQLSEIAEPLRVLGNSAERAQSRAEKRRAIEQLNQLVTRDAGTGFVVFPTSAGGTSQINLFNDVLGQNCNAGASQQCGEATSVAQILWQTAGYYRALADSLNQEDKAASLAFNQRLEQQWRSYKDDTIKLWPQEVMLNSLVYKPRQEGLSGPPNYKLLALRPSLGISYLSDQSHRIQPTINLDIIGFYWWRYGGSDQTKAQPGRGLSAGLVWDGDDTAYGLTYHHNPRWSATVAHGDDNDVVLSISFQLAYWLVAK